MHSTSSPSPGDRGSRVPSRLMGAAALLFSLLVFSGGNPAFAQDPVAANLDKMGCLECHASDAEAIEVEADDGETRELRAVAPSVFDQAAHAKLQCVDCHENVVDSKSEHALSEAPKPDCATCHEKLWEAAKKDGSAGSKPNLETVAKNIAAYRDSFHARPDADFPDRPKASCEQCHNSHEFKLRTKGSPEHDKWRSDIPKLCGESCHEDHLEDFTTSVHGVAHFEKGKTEAAVCSDCHTAHNIDNTSKDPVKLAITASCGNCHEDQYKTYRASYHGKITTLGYAHTAKCFDCHGSHDILAPDDAESSVHVDNRLETCQECHDGKKAREASAGFVSFAPHGHGGDFEKYPQIWLVEKGMIGLLVGTFSFFWLHLLLWLYREFKERSAGRTEPHVRVADLNIPAGKHFRRFGPWERAGHLVFAISLMILTLTGMTLMYADSAWAPVVARMLGGPEVMAIIHRVNAVIFASVFVIHVLWVVGFLIRSWKTFKIFGPESVVPNLKDLQDVIGMFKWFFGKGPKPIFDRWTYWEKFDYWAPFWGVNIVGVSGFIMWFPTLAATYLPGWVFNVAAIAHGEEAFLAAVFLFTVHFFNNHFRPDKLPPPDIVMFTGTVHLEELRHEHPAQYERLVKSGELEKYLVDAPSAPMTLGSKILGLVLIAAGLTLLVLIGVGFFGAL